MVVKDLTLDAGLEHSLLCRLTFQLAPASTSGEDADAKEQGSTAAQDTGRLSATCKRFSRAKGCEDCVLWPATGGGLSVVTCLPKCALARMFKAVYTQQTALGVRVGKDIKSVADVKPLQGQQLHNAVAAGVARTLEAAGWLCLKPGTWLRLTPDALFSAVPGRAHVVEQAQLAVDPPQCAATKTIKVTVLSAGIVQFTPLSVVHELQALLGKATAGTATDAATAAGAPDAAAQAAWLRDHVFSSRETWRRAERLLFNKQCVVLPNLTPVYIKGLCFPGADPHVPHQTHIHTDTEAFRERWERVAPHLPLPEALPQEGLMLHVAQDLDSDTGDSGVWQVPAACCWVAPGLTRPLHTVTTQDTTASTTLDTVTQQTQTHAGDGARTAAGAASQPGSLWTTAARVAAGETQQSQLLLAASQQPQQPTQQPQLQPTQQQGHTAGARGGGGASVEEYVPWPMALPASASFWRANHANTGSDGTMGADDHETGDALAAAVAGDWRDDPRVAAALARRAEVRDAERAQWSDLRAFLNERDKANEDVGTTHPSTQGPRAASGAQQPSAVRPAARPVPVLIGRQRAAGSNLTAGKKPAAAAATLAKSKTAAKATAAATAGKAAASTAAGTAAKPAAGKAATTAKTTAAGKGTAKAAKGAAAAAGPAKTPLPSGAAAGPAATATCAAGTAAAAAADGQVQLTPASQAAAGAAPAAAPNTQQTEAGQKRPAAATVAAQAGGAGDAAEGAAGAAPARKRTKAADIDLSAVEAKISAKAASGTLSGITVPELQAWLRARKLTVGGKRAELETRVLGAMGISTAQPTQQDPTPAVA